MKHKFLVLKIILTVLFSLAGCYIGFIAFVFDLFNGTKFTALAVVFTLAAILLFIWFKKKKKWAIISLAIVFIGWGMVGADRLYTQYQESLVVNTDVNIKISEYLPHVQDSKIIHLDHEASLKLTDNLPKLDGAAAVFPVYSSFVDAVYPEQYNTEFKDDPLYGPVNDDPSNVQALNYFNTPLGYKALAEKKTDIFFGAYPSKEQLEYAEQCGTEFVFTPIGKEAFVFFVHAKSDVNNLSVDDIKKIYTREITNWADLGFKNQDIIPYQRNEGSGSQSIFLNFMGDTKPAEPTMQEEVDMMVGAYQRVADYKNSKGAIGFSFRYYLNSIIARDDIKIISVNGIQPNVENIKNGSYPITGDLYAVTWKDNPNENVQKLIDWICSDEGQYIIEKTGYVPIK